MTTETPKGIRFSLLLQDILEIVSLPEEIIRIVFAVALSTKLNLFPPLWLMLVGVPSSAKTDLVSLLRKLDFVYFLDSMTLNPFASGYKATGKAKTFDLLPELAKKCFVCKDYTTIFSLNEETTKKLLGELVAIYDGEFSKFSPTRGLISYKSIFSHLGCITPATLNVHQRYLNIIGPRFLFYRIPDLTEERKKRGFLIAWHKKSRKEEISALGDKVIIFFEDLLPRVTELFEITDDTVKETLQSLSILMAKSRGILIMQKGNFTNEEGKEVNYYDITDKQIEEPWQAFQQLKGLAVVLALLDERQRVNEADIEVLKHIVISSMPAERAEVLGYFLNKETLVSRELSELTGKSIRTCQRLLKELEGLGIIRSDQSELLARVYTLEDDFKFLVTDKPQSAIPSEFMSQLIPNKPVVNYTDDELEGVGQLIKDCLKEIGDLNENTKKQYIDLAEEIRKESLGRNLLNTSNLAVEDQMTIGTILSGTEPRVRF